MKKILICSALVLTFAISLFSFELKKSNADSVLDETTLASEVEVVNADSVEKEGIEYNEYDFLNPEYLICDKEFVYFTFHIPDVSTYLDVDNIEYDYCQFEFEFESKTTSDTVFLSFDDINPHFIFDSCDNSYDPDSDTFTVDICLSSAYYFYLEYYDINTFIVEFYLSDGTYRIEFLQDVSNYIREFTLCFDYDFVIDTYGQPYYIAALPTNYYFNCEFIHPDGDPETFVSSDLEFFINSEDYLVVDCYTSQFITLGLERELAFNDGYNEGKNDGYEDAVNSFINSSNPYISKYNQSGCKLRVALNTTIEGSPAYIDITDFDMFANPITGGYDLKNLVRYGDMLYKGVIKPTDIDSTLPEQACIDPTKGLTILLDLQNGFKMCDYEYTLNYIDSITFYTERSVPYYNFTPSSYQGECPVIFASSEATAVITDVVMGISYQNCHSIASLSDFEDTTYCSFTSKAKNNDYSTGWNEGFQTGLEQSQQAIEESYNNGYNDGYAEAENEIFNNPDSFIESNRFAGSELENILDEKYEDGFTEGKQIGFNDGYDEGYSEALNETDKLAYNQGYEAGVQHVLDYAKDYYTEEYKNTQLYMLVLAEYNSGYVSGQNYVLNNPGQYYEDPQYANSVFSHYINHQAQTSYQSGFTSGYTEGEIKGTEVGYKNGYQQGLSELDAYNIGYTDGYAAGEAANPQLSFWQRLAQFFAKIFAAIEEAFK